MSFSKAIAGFLQSLMLGLFFVPVQILSSHQVMAEISAEKDARNRVSFASRQRMLTQQIARNACFVMADIDPERFAAKTDAAVRQFDTTHKGLLEGDANLELLAESNAQVIAQLAKVEELWNTLGAAARQISAGDLHSVPMTQLIQLNIKTLSAMQEAVSLIRVAYSDTAVPQELKRTIDIAGRQRMLSQKASKEVCFLMLDVGGQKTVDELQATIAAFEAGMDSLLSGSEEQGVIAPPNRQIKKQLERTAKAWNRFKKLLVEFEANPDQTPGDRVKLANLSDQVLREMDLAVWMYAEQ